MTKDKQKLKAQRRRNYLKHRDARIRYATTYSRTNGEVCNERRRIHRLKLRSAVLAKLGNKCVRCGFNEILALQVDHVNGGGRHERQQTGLKNGSTTRYLNKILADTTGAYQLLCANCNIIKYRSEGA